MFVVVVLLFCQLSVINSLCLQLSLFFSIFAHMDTSSASSLIPFNLEPVRQHSTPLISQLHSLLLNSQLYLHILEFCKTFGTQLQLFYVCAWRKGIGASGEYERFVGFCFLFFFSNR
ncbi:hypothetical protein VPH35_043847 [Triticum aestivum]